MESIGSRIKAVRKALNLTTTKFGERIGIKNPSVSMIETGKSNPSDRTILSICREFNVNENWLRTGEGERAIGSWQAGDPAEALAHYGRRFADLATEVTLLEARLASGV